MCPSHLLVRYVKDQLKENALNAGIFFVICMYVKVIRILLSVGWCLAVVAITAMIVGVSMSVNLRRMLLSFGE